MSRRIINASQKLFLDRIRALEERLFADQLYQDDRRSAKSDRKRLWHFRPSHHGETGLVTQEDVSLLSQPNKRLLSVGAYPGFLERILMELGVPIENILLTDNDPAIAACAPMQTVTFDATDPWPDIGTFDRILFPESLCIALGDRMKREGIEKDAEHSSDAREAELLAGVLQEALRRLRPEGVIRANGPMSHPTVLRNAAEKLQEKGLPISLESSRFFLTIQHSEKKK